MPWTKNRSCDGKRQHETRASGRAHVRRLRRHYAGQRLHVYRCKFCGFFHVGHRPRRRRH